MAVYRSAHGRQVDMTSLAAKNERVRAVGNMNVNARGDIIDSNNKVTKDTTKRVKGSYGKTVNNAAPKPAPAPVINTQLRELTPEEQMFEDDDEDIKK